MKGYQKKSQCKQCCSWSLPCHHRSRYRGWAGQDLQQEVSPTSPCPGPPLHGPTPPPHPPSRQGWGSLPAPTAGRAPAKTSPLGALVSVHREQLLGTAARAKGPGCPSRSQWAAS